MYENYKKINLISNNNVTIKIGDIVNPLDAWIMTRIHGSVYGGGAWNSRPEIDYKFRNRMGKPHEVVNIFKGDYNTILELKTKTNKINLFISINDTKEISKERLNKIGIYV